MGLLETVATGVAIGAALFFGRKWLRRINGFDGDEIVQPIEPFAKKADVSATKGEHVPIGSPRPGIDFFKAYILKSYGGKDAGVWGDEAHQARVSDHNVGRAWDWSFPTEEARDKAIEWLAANRWEYARRLGVGTIITNGKIWSSWVDGEKPFQRAHTGDPHRKHVHFSFSRDGSMGKTSGFELLRPH